MTEQVRQSLSRHQNKTGIFMQSTFTINIDLFNRALLLFINYAINEEFRELTKTPDTLGVIFFFYKILADVALIGAAFAVRRTAFSFDLMEMGVISLSFSIMYLVSFLMYFKVSAVPYETLIYLIPPVDRIIYVLLTVRAAWPLINNEGAYKTWPIFGFLGLACKFMKKEIAPKPIGKEVGFSYAAILLAVAIGLVLWHYQINNLGLHHHFLMIISIGFLADFSYKRSMLAQAKSKRAYRLAAHATRKAEAAKVNAEAEAARLAGECQALQAAIAETKKIIAHQMDVFAQAQDDHSKERARLALLEAAIANGHGAVADAGLLSEILNPDNPHYSIRMVACVKMFEYFQGKSIAGKSAKDAIAKYAMDHAAELGLLYKGEPSQNAADQCAFVLNWVHEAGAPRTQARAEETPLQIMPA